MTTRSATSSVTFSRFARSLVAETAFDVLAVAKQLEAKSKDVIELQIGDSPFPTPAHARAAGIAAIEAGHTHYCPSAGLSSFRQAIATNYEKEFGVAVRPEQVIVAPGAKVFEQFFCEVFLDPDDEVLVFSPAFPTYVPNIARRGAIPVFSPLRVDNAFRPNLDDVRHFIRDRPRARAILLNSPHNPTGGVVTREDMLGLADLIRGTNVALFSDEPYCHMVWEGKHVTPLQIEGMWPHTVCAYTFSKSYSMSGWRLGYAICQDAVAEQFSKMINTSLSCVPPMLQLAGQAALEHDDLERDECMKRFQRKVELLIAALQEVPEVKVKMPAGTFYAFPDVSAICRRANLTSHGLAMYLLEGADERRGVACLGGECFGAAGQGFLRFSCAEPDDRLVEAVNFLREAVTRTERMERYLQSHPQYRLSS